MAPTSRRGVLQAFGALAGVLGGCQQRLDPSETSAPTGTATTTATSTPPPTDSTTPPKRNDSCNDSWESADRWRFELESNARPPVVSDGAVFFGTGRSVLHALNANDGSVRWRGEQKFQFDGRPVVDDGVVVASAYREITAYDADDGTALWTFDPPGNTAGISRDAVITDGRAVVAVDGDIDPTEEVLEEPYHRLYAVDLGTGEPAWTAALPEDTAAEGLSAAGRTVYVTTTDRQLIAVDATTSERAWERSLGPGNDARYRPVVGENAVYVQSRGTLYAVDAADGALRWRDDGGFKGEPAVGDGAVYRVSGKDLVSYDPTTGRRQWRAALPVERGIVLGTTTDSVFAAVEEPDRAVVFAFDAEKGCRLGRYEVTASGVTGAAFSDDTLFFGGDRVGAELHAVGLP